MNRNITIAIVKTVKYISILSLAFFIIFNTDVLINFTTGDIQYFLKNIVVFIKTHSRITSVILLLSLLAAAICNFIIRHIKLDETDNCLSKIETDNKYNIAECQREYNNLSEYTKNLEEDLRKSKTYLYENTNSKILKLSKHSVKMENHFERRKDNYFYTNKKFYNIVKMSKQIDNDTLQLISTFENEILK